MSKEKEITKSRIIDFKKEADRLLKTYYKSKTYVNKHQLANSVATGPAPRFYTTVETAMRRVKEISTGALTITNPNQIMMFEEINKRYQEKLKEYGAKKYKTDIMYEVITSPAPSFYVTPKFAYKLLYMNEE